MSPERSAGDACNAGVAGGGYARYRVTSAAGKPCRSEVVPRVDPSWQQGGIFACSKVAEISEKEA